MEMFEDNSGNGGDGQVQTTSVLVESWSPVKVNASPVGRQCTPVEKKLKKFAAHLSMVERITSYLRRVETLWASMVLLSGFGSELSIRDFWFSTAVLFVNNLRILKRKYADDQDIEEQKRGPSRGCQTESFVQNCRKVVSPRLFPLRRILITILIIIKCAAAMYLCIKTASVPSRVLVANGLDPNTTIARNKKYSLLVLYGLVITEGVLFLFGDLYYMYKIYWCKQLHDLRNSLQFASSSNDMELVRGFFIDSIYSPDPDKDMVTYAVDLLASNSRCRELMGLRIMIVLGNDLNAEMLRNIGVNLTALKTLVRMLKWEDKDKRISAAKVLSNLAKVKENNLDIAGMLGSIKAISYLFDEARAGEHTTAFIDLGFQIIEEMALDQDDCEKIGKTKGLLGKIVSFTKVDPSRQEKEDTYLVERSLIVLKLVTSQRGITWKNIRSEISEMNLVENIQLILAHGKKYDIKLKKLAMEVLSNLAEEDNAKERIGDTNGVLESLQKIFFGEEDDDGGPPVNLGDEENYDFRLHAGKVLQQLAKKSKGNCLRILKMKDKNKKFKDAFMNLNWSVPRRITVARILLHLCINSGASLGLKSLLRATRDMVLKGITDDKVEVVDLMVGITTFGVKLDNWINYLNIAGINKLALASKLKEILTRHKYDISKERPNVCDLLVEMALFMVKYDPKYIQVLMETGIQEEMKDILETTPKIKEIIDLLDNIGRKTKKKKTRQGSKDVRSILLAS